MARFGYGIGLLILYWATAATAGSINAQITAEDGTPLPNAVVFAIPLNGAITKPSQKSLMVQENQQFAPFVLPVQVGTNVEFPNRDSFRHHVYSFSPAKSFELKLFGGTETQIVNFDKEGVVALGCNIHDNMLAYIYVVPTPHFVKTDDKGQAVLNNLPAGAYTVKVWHPNQKSSNEQAAPLTIANEAASDFKAVLAMKRERKQKKSGAKDETDY
jgi:plastocyanin